MADEKDIAVETPGGGRKRLIIMGAVAVLLLLGAGAAAFFLSGGDDADVAGGEPVAEESAVELGDPLYHKLSPAFIANLPPGGQAKMLQIAIEVMSYSPTVAETLKANDPMIRHHLLNLLEGQEAGDLLTQQGKTALQQAVQDLLGQQLKELNEPGEIKGVFFTEFVMQ